MRSEREGEGVSVMRSSRVSGGLVIEEVFSEVDMMRRRMVTGFVVESLYAVDRMA
jgi:hypothetical protein